MKVFAKRNLLIENLDLIIQSSKQGKQKQKQKYIIKKATQAIGEMQE